MEANKTETATPDTQKNEVRGTIEKQLEVALAYWKEQLGEKRFKKRIKKAGKIFGKKLKKTLLKKVAKKKSISSDKKKKAA